MIHCVSKAPSGCGAGASGAGCGAAGVGAPGTGAGAAPGVGVAVIPGLDVFAIHPDSHHLILSSVHPEAFFYQI